ncbi:MAG: alpha/beta hydrolase-fold protein [Chloroflexota bacterium]
MARWDSFVQFLQEADQLSNDVSRQQLVEQLLSERPRWPWIEGNLATFIHLAENAENVALNLDIIERDPPFEIMGNLEGTDLWYVQREFEMDDLLDYMIVFNDPMTPLRNDPNLPQRIANWQPDDFNQQVVSNGALRVSVLSMPHARPFPDWNRLLRVEHGMIREHDFTSIQMGFTDRRLWIYTPPGYEDDPDREYPLMLLLDGQWMVGPLQVPAIADALIKHNRMQPIIIAMQESGGAGARQRDYVSNDKHYASVMTELVPLLQTEYRIDSTNLGIGGAGVGAIAAAHTALKNSAVFSHLIMLSPPLGKGQMQKQLLEYADRFENARVLPERIFQSVGRYEQQLRFYKPGLALAGILQRRQANRGDIEHKFVEIGSGHGLAAFRSVIPEALSHIFPGDAFYG